MRTTAPHEAKDAPELDLDNPQVENAVHSTVVAVAGFVYPGDTQDAIISALRFLSARPDVRAALWPQTVLTLPEWGAKGAYDSELLPVQAQDDKERLDLKESVIAALAQVPYAEWRKTSHEAKNGLRNALGPQADNLIRVLSDIPTDPS